jgi:hypothetical protein
MNGWKQTMVGQRNADVNVSKFAVVDVVVVIVLIRQSWHMLFVMYAKVMAQTDKHTWGK